VDPRTVDDLRLLPEPEIVRSGEVGLPVRRIGTGPRLVLLHGGPGLDHHLLLPLALHLGDRFEVWLPDLPGHGDATKDWLRLPGLVEVRDRIARWLAGLPGGAGILGGHSLGAWVAREACRRGRVRPVGLVLISPPAGGGRDATARTRSEAVKAIRLGRPPAPRERANAIREEFARFIAGEMSGDVSDLFDQAFSLSRLRSPRDYTRFQRELGRARRKPTPAWEPDLPVLILCGDRDATTPVVNAREVAAATPGAALEILEGVGHFPWADGSRVTADAILSFLERNRADSVPPTTGGRT